MIRRSNPGSVGLDSLVDAPGDCSKNELRGDLSDTRRRLDGSDSPERRASEIAVRSPKLSVIKGVKELGPDLQQHTFPDDSILV